MRPADGKRDAASAQQPKPFLSSSGSNKNGGTQQPPAAASSSTLQTTRSAGRLQPSGASSDTQAAQALKPLRRAPSSKRSASSLASSLITSLSSAGGNASSNAPTGSTAPPSSSSLDGPAFQASASNSGANLPAIGSRTASGKASAFVTAGSGAGAGAALGAFSQAAAASSSSSRPHSGAAALKHARSYSPVGTSSGPTGTAAGVAATRAASTGLPGRAAGGLLREGSALSVASSTDSGSRSLTPTARSFTEQGANAVLQAPRGKGSAGQQLPPLSSLLFPSNPGSASRDSLEGGKVMLYKEAAVKFLDPLGQPLSADSGNGAGGGSSSSSVCAASAVQFLSSSGGSTASAPADAGAPASSVSAPGGRGQTARSRSRVSFHIAAKVSFLESSDGGAATGPSSTPEKESSNPTGASVGSQGGSSDAGGSRAGGSAAGGSAAGGYISTAAGQLCHMQVMRGSIVGVPLPQQSPEAIAGQALGKGDSSRSERGPSTSGDTTQGGLKGGLLAIANKFKQLALVLADSNDSTSQHGGGAAPVGDNSSSSTEASPSSTSDGGSLSFSPAPTPKDGTSVLRATVYKQHHGYLPTPSASLAGGLQRGMSQKTLSGAGTPVSRAGSTSASRAGSMSVSRAGSTTLSRPSSKPVSRANSTKLADTAAPAGEPLWSGCDAAEGGSVGGGSVRPQDSSTAGMTPLPPGAVPVFGSAAAATCTEAPLRSSRQLGPRPDDACVSSLYQGSGSGGSSGSSGGGQSSGQSSSAVPIKLGPASLPGPLLLAVSPWLPKALQRDYWCLSDFVVQKKLYDGYASTICKAKDRRSGMTVALKLYRMHKLNDISSHQVAREVRLHCGLQHENIISLYAAWQEAGNVVLLQEFAGHGDLWSFIDSNSGRLTERVTVSLVLQPFLRGLQFLHSSGIAHRDIKPENVLFGSNMVLKLADLGLAVNLREEPAVTRVGTLDYMAPEVLRCPLKRHPGDNKERSDLHYATAVDAWAVGVLAYELLTGRAPFTPAGASDATIQSAICTAAPVFPSRMSEPSKQFITAALSKQPSARPTVLQMLQHPWIRSFQRSCSTARAEPRTSQELGGTGRLLMPSNSTQPAEPAGQRPPPPSQGAPVPVTSAGSSSSSGAASASGALGSNGGSQAAPSPQLHRQASLLSAGGSSQAAAAGVWNSDDNGLTGYAMGI